MTKTNLPDVALESQKTLQPLQKVGMKGIELPIQLKQTSVRLAAKVNAQVSLDKKASRGIHMSRLYMIVQDLAQKPLGLSDLGEALNGFLKTHEDLSSEAFLSLQFEVPVLRKALKSENQAWRNYPLILSVERRKGQGLKYFVEVLVTYSSTCPASAALSRQLIQENFQKDFGGRNLDPEAIQQWLGSSTGIIATPHAQRSQARVKVEVGPDFDFVQLLDWVEDAVQTPVQGAVKREDEQEFALRNGQNLMFCEDAARRVFGALEAQTSILDFVAEMSHLESLHPHDAVAQVNKGLRLESF